MNIPRPTSQSTHPALLAHVLGIAGVLGLYATPIGAEQATQTPAVLVRADALTATAVRTSEKRIRCCMIAASISKRFGPLKKS